MADLEVENTLREIRERVLAGSRSRAEAQPAPQALTTDGDTTKAAHDGASGEALARMQANLSTTERAWSRLPPLLSYRRGLAARVELWVKRQVKRAAHWFTWEQVNFNSAAHHALQDAREALAAHDQALAAHDQALAQLREQLRALQSESQSNASHLDELQARIAAAESRFDSGVAELRRSLDEVSGQLRAEQNVLAAEQRATVAARAEEIRGEMRDRVEALVEEQRVCFKQLSLEATEAAVRADRARRQIEARIEELEKKSGV